MSHRAAASSKPVILVAPSWGKNNLIEQFGNNIITNLLASNYRVILRPHPESWKFIAPLLNQLAKTFSSSPDFFLEKSVATNHSLLQADVLICDLSGVALEYALGTFRPVLFIDIPPKIKNSAFRDLGIEPLELKIRSKIGRIISPQNIHLISREVSDLLNNQFSYRDKLIQLRRQVVYNLGSSSAIAAEYLLTLLRS